MRKLSIIFALVLCIAFGGCGKQEPKPTDTNKPTDSTASTTEATKINTEADQFYNDLKASIENLEGPLGTAPVFGEESENAGHFVFKVNQDVKNFRFFKVNTTYDEDANRLAGELAKTYGTRESLGADEEVLLIGNVGEILPTLAVSFDSEDGASHYYAIEISGEDGKAMLTPFDIAE